MKKLATAMRYFSAGEWLLWGGSVALIVSSYLLFDQESVMNMVASLLGVTSLIFVAKGNPIGQAIMIVFCTLYGGISLSFRYYGEMLTYLLMSLPMAVVALVSWLKHPYRGKRSEVSVGRVGKRELCFLCALALTVTVLFYFLLRALNTANLAVSTLSVTTSFAAAYLLYLRSPYYALAYALNDVVLIVLWTLACMQDIQYLSVVVCFVAFFANDVYGYISWHAMERRQGVSG